jgi:hypothetical protein
MMLTVVDLSVAIVAGATDPFMWILPIVAACISRRRWVVVGLGLVGAVADRLLAMALRPAGPAPVPLDPVMVIGGLIGGALVGLICFGIATAIRNRRKRPAAS